jgi:release factor H-coupled RctB family protein
MGTLIKEIPITSDVANNKAKVRIVISDKNWLESSAIEQLKKTAELPGMCCGIGMPDLHPGKGQPIGAAFISHDIVYPHLVGSDIGCGMGVWKLDVQKKRVKLDKWEKKLTGLDEAWEGNPAEWLKAHGRSMEGEPSLIDSLHSEASHAINSKLGTIGGGNHFAELQVVSEIFDHESFSSIGLDENSVTLLVHSGSRGLGQSILRAHVDEYGAQGLSSIESQNYLQQHDNAENWAVCNRALIAHRFCERLGVKAESILDVSHNTVLKLNANEVNALGLSERDHNSSESAKGSYKEVKDFWIHRKGASPTDKGLVIIPGSRGTLSYLVKPKRDLSALAMGGFSLAHGAGRKWKRSDARGRLEKRYHVKDLETTKLGSRVICKSRDLLYEEAPQAYKDIDLVVDDLVKAGMVDVIASFKPLITYKTRKK